MSETMERRTWAIERKRTVVDAASGTFTGYASVFGVRDAQDDVVAPGAFTETLAAMRKRGFFVPMYLNHGAAMGGDNLPAGVWESMTEDAYGLAVKGRLLGIGTERGAYNLALVTGGALRGMSIGFTARRADYAKKPGDPRRVLRAVDLREISLVDDPSNPSATVQAIGGASVARSAVPLVESLRDLAATISGGRKSAVTAADLRGLLVAMRPAW